MLPFRTGDRSTPPAEPRQSYASHPVREAVAGLPMAGRHAIMAPMGIPRHAGSAGPLNEPVSGSREEDRFELPIDVRGERNIGDDQRSCWHHVRRDLPFEDTFRTRPCGPIFPRR